jgi:protein-tyrosine phosphatase
VKVLAAASGILLAVLVIAIAGMGRERLRGRPYAFEHVDVPGVENAGRVGPRLLRGAQPSTAGFAALQRLGVRIVVSLTIGRDDQHDERDIVERLGMRYVHLPWSAMHEPPPEHVTAFLDLIRGHPDEVVFVHCKAGVDRTGVMVASYRVLVEHWRAADAVAEMNAFGFHRLFHPQLERYVHALADATRLH